MAGSAIAKRDAAALLTKCAASHTALAAPLLRIIRPHWEPDGRASLRRHGANPVWSRRKDILAACLHASCERVSARLLVATSAPAMKRFGRRSVQGCDPLTRLPKRRGFASHGFVVEPATPWPVSTRGAASKAPMQSRRKTLPRAKSQLPNLPNHPFGPSTAD